MLSAARTSRSHPVLLPALAAITLAAVPPVVVAADWTVAVGRTPARSSLSPEVGPRWDDLLWSGSRPGIVAQQGVAAGDLVVVNRITSFTIPTGTWIVGHDLYTGEERWAIQLPKEFEDSWRSRVTGIRDGQVYASRSGNTNAEYLYALDPEDGSILWRSEDLITESSTESVTFAPDGDIITSGEGVLLRIDRTDGTTVWAVPRSCPTSGGCDAVVFGDRAYIWEASPDGPKVTAIDIAAGMKLYSSDGITPGWIQQIGLLVGPDGTIYAPRSMNNPATDYFVALEDTGTEFVEKWRVPMGYTPFASFAVGPDGTVYTYSRDQEIMRLDPERGDILNTSQQVFFESTASARIAVDRFGRVYLTNGGFATGELFVFNADLTPRWSTKITNVNVGGPILSESGIMVVCGVGTDVRAYWTPAPGDFDEDGYVDLADHPYFVDCMAGPNTTPDPTAPTTVEDCLTVFDADEDEDVDLEDFRWIAGLFDGA